jgi:hypothetical protein
MLNGARPESGNWVIPNELGNELGNDGRKDMDTYYALKGRPARNMNPQRWLRLLCQPTIH